LSVVLCLQPERMDENARDLCLFRITAVLNNVGITAMERGAYRKSSECFKDAICIIKDILPTTGTSLHSHLQHAERILNSWEREVACLRGSKSYLSIESIDVSDRMSLCVMATLEEEPLKQQFSPVRIDSIEDLPFDMGASILMYNNGLAHFCMWIQSMRHGSESTTHAHSYNVCAHKLLAFSESILVNAMAKFGCEVFIYDTIVTVSSLVLRSIWHLLSEDGKWEEAQTAYLRYQSLTRSAQELSMLSDIGIHSAGAA
jgi:hypothetical protein